MIKRSGRSDEMAEKLDIEDLLSRFPITGSDRTWSVRPVVSRAYSAAHRIFDKRFEGKLRVDKSTDNV